MLIRLPGTGLEGSREATSGELSVLRMDMTFDSGRRIEIVERGTRLGAQVQVSYTGSGILRARWEIAEPSGAAEPQFRVLAQVRESMSGERTRTLASPALPTQISGRYLLRFCAEAASALVIGCESADTALQTLYQVTPGEALRVLRVIQPDNQVVDATTVFRWPAVDGATNYQLQIFRAVEPEPEFVAGMLLDSSVTQTALSEVTHAKLSPGERYLWRITAHDSDGRLIARSDAAPIIYLPGEPGEAP